MKLSRLSLISLAALLGLGFASCERKYDAPLLADPTVTPGDEKVITIAEYKDKFKKVPKEGQIIEDNLAIRAVVVGNDVSGNIYKQIYVQDATGGISIGIDQNNISNDYQVGQEVFIKLQGLAATSYGGVTQIGMKDTQSNRIPYEVVKKQILRDKRPDAEKAKPKTTTIAQFSDNMVGTLIKLENVYFELGGTATYGDQAQNAVNRTLKDTTGKKLIVRNSKYASFANDVLPKGNGTVVGILSKFNKDYQLFIRTADDCSGFTGKDPITGGEVNPNPPAGNVIYAEAFSKGLGAFTAISISGANKWTAKEYKGKTYASMSGFTSGKSVANEDWLVSPAFDLTSAKSISLSFQHTINKGDVSKMKQEQTLWVSTNYTGKVADATWTQVEIPVYPAGNNWTYVKSGDIVFPESVLGQSKVVFAYKYVCTDASSGQWQVQDIKVTSEGGKLAAGGTEPAPQPKPDPQPDPTPGALLFPGSDFEDWSLMVKGKSLSYDLPEYVMQSDKGRNGKALHINGKIEKNGYVITAAGNGAKSGNTISLYFNGKADKSLSFLIYKEDGSSVIYNLDDFGGKGHVVSPADGDIVLKPTAYTFSGKISNSYTRGKIDTQGKWMKITLDISSFKQLAKEKNLFSIKMGNKVAYDILIDDITIQ